MITAVVLLLFVSVAIMLGLGSTVIKDIKITGDFVKSKQAYLTAESGVEDISYRLKNGKQTSSPEILILGNSLATTTITDVGGDKEVLAKGDMENGIRKVKTRLTIVPASSGISFNYGVQVGDGGFFLENNSEIKGNVYSNGPITGQNSNIIRGDAVSAAAGGLFDNAHATGTVRAHTITNSTIDKDAYYVTKTGTTVLGTSYPGSSDQPKIPLPIADSDVALWETDALNGGTISSPCPYTIIANVTIGPKKIACDLIISGSPTVTLTGTIWVTGNITVMNSAILQVSPSLPGKSVTIIADNPSNRTTSSKITLQNDSVYNGSGIGSYIFFLSQNNSSELGGSEFAIDGKNNIIGSAVLYAGHGEILIENNIQFKEVTGYKIHSKNNAIITYESGLASPLFTGGPAGSFTVQEWREVK